MSLLSPPVRAMEVVMKTVAWVGAALLAGAAVGCSTAMPTDTPGVTRVGATALRYAGPDVEAVLSYRFAGTSIGDDWMLLDVAMSGARHESVEVTRAGITLRTPSGEDLPLADQGEFAAAYGALAPVLARADVGAEPLDYWSGRRDQPIEFFSPPGQSLVFPSFWVNDRLVYSGRLYFQVPGGIQPGRYELRVKLVESELRIPFTLGAT
jgi:hypothetical protein